MGAALPVISGVGSVVSAVGGKNAQNAATQASQQDTAAQNKAVGAEETGIAQALQNFFGSGGGAAGQNQLMQYLQGQQGQTYSSPYTQAASNTASQLQNYNGLTQPELNALQTTLGNSGQSTVKTLMSQLGSTGNPAGLAQSLLNSNQQNALNSTVQLGSIASQQQLGALENAGSLQSALSGQNLDYGQNNTANQLSLYGQQQGLATSGLSDLGQIGSQYGAAASGAANTAASYGSPFGSALSSIGGLTFPSSGGTSTPATQFSGLGGYTPQPVNTGTTYTVGPGGLYQATPGS